MATRRCSTDRVRTCQRCGLTKVDTEFIYKDRGRGLRHVWCRSCFAEYKRVWYQEHREGHIEHVRRNQIRAQADHRVRVWQYLSEHPCVDCGEADLLVLEFDHVRDKLHDVSSMVNGAYSWEAIQAEIDKCEVRCANCHRRRTARQRGYYDRKRSAFGEEPGPWYGLRAG